LLTGFGQKTSYSVRALATQLHRVHGRYLVLRRVKTMPALTLLTLTGSPRKEISNLELCARATMRGYKPELPSPPFISEVGSRSTSRRHSPPRVYQTVSQLMHRSKGESWKILHLVSRISSRPGKIRCQPWMRKLSSETSTDSSRDLRRKFVGCGFRLS